MGTRIRVLLYILQLGSSEDVGKGREEESVTWRLETWRNDLRRVTDDVETGDDEAAMDVCEEQGVYSI